MKTKTMTQTALMTAVICILAPMTIPIGAVPISLTNLAVCLSVYLLGLKRGTLSYLIYYILGCFGLPVFSGFQGGLAKALGPTGGCLIGFFLLALISGIFIEKSGKKYIHLLGMILGGIAVYCIGVPWFAFVMQTSMKQAFMTACAPFILIDILKCVFVLLVGSEIKKRLPR